MIVLDKHYTIESLSDLDNDIHTSIGIAELPVDENYMTKGSFRVVIEWVGDATELTVEEKIAEMHVIERRKDDVCFECGAPADFVRSTQFAGEHTYCREHALKEEDFGDSDGSYFYWYRVE